jgi:hypothetical protein
MTDRSKARGLRLVLLVVVGLAAAAGIAAAVIPSSDSGTISACYQRQSGVLRVIDAQGGGTCLPNESRISWSSGSASAGLSGVEMVAVTLPFGTFEGTASCPAGKVVTGGSARSIGYDRWAYPFPGPAGDPVVTHVTDGVYGGGGPIGGNPPTGWYASGLGSLPSGDQRTAYVQSGGAVVYAICATAAP